MLPGVLVFQYWGWRFEVWRACASSSTRSSGAVAPRSGGRGFYPGRCGLTATFVSPLLASFSCGSIKHDARVLHRILERRVSIFFLFDDAFAATARVRWTMLACCAGTSRSSLLFPVCWGPLCVCAVHLYVSGVFRLGCVGCTCIWLFPLNEHVAF